MKPQDFQTYKTSLALQNYQNCETYRSKNNIVRLLKFDLN